MTAARGTAHLDATFAALRKQGRKALIVYLMAGDPTPAFTARLVPKVAQAGADIVELGFPFSDPVADGPVIQAAGQRALPHIADVPAYLEVVRAVRAACALPLVTMAYYNPIFRFGEREFLQAGLAAGLDGAIIPDLPLVEGEGWRALCAEAGLAAIFLEAPNTTAAASQRIAAAATGFIYLISLKGVTGSERGLGENLAERAARLRQVAATPLAVGFGISTPEQARRMAALCDGVVVGSSVIARMADKAPDEAEAAVVEYVTELRKALDAG